MLHTLVLWKPAGDLEAARPHWLCIAVHHRGEVAGRYVVSPWKPQVGDLYHLICLWPVGAAYAGSSATVYLDEQARPLIAQEWQARERRLARERVAARVTCLRRAWQTAPETAREKARAWAGDTALWQAAA